MSALPPRTPNPPHKLSITRQRSQPRTHNIQVSDQSPNPASTSDLGLTALTRRTSSTGGNRTSSQPSLHQTSPTMMPMTTKSGTSDTKIKAIACVCLCLQNSALVLSQRYSRYVLNEKYLGSVVVLCMELLKFALCAILMFRDGSTMADIGRVIKCSLPMAVPGGVYVIQNGLQLVSLQYLDAGVFSILSQLKILTTAVFAGTLLGQHQTARKWRALLLLVVGAVLVQYDPNQSAAGIDVASSAQFTGLLAVVGMVCCSGFAGIYLEKYLKAADLTLWQRNMQLSAWGIVFACITLLNDWTSIQANGLFYGFSSFTLLVVLLSAGGGLIVAVVVKYTSTVIKGFATSASIIITSVISVSLFGIQLNMLFVLGSVCVLTSIFNYNEPQDIKTVQASERLQKDIEQIPLMDVTVKNLSY